MAGNTATLGLGGNPATTSVSNLFVAGGTSVANINAQTTHGGIEVLSGALSAGVFAAVPGMSFTGRGSIPLLSCYAKDTTSRTLRMRVTVDGVAVFTSAASNAITVANTGIYAAGEFTGTGYFGQGYPIRFNSSCLVEVASSLGETDKVAVGYVLHKE